MMLNAQFTNISAKSWWSALLLDVSTRRKPPTCRNSLTYFMTLRCIA